MAERDEIEALLARAESAAGPDREIDCAVHWLVKPVLRSLGSFEDWMGTDSSKSVTPSYTESLDAIVGLIEREMPNHNVHVFSDCGSYFARVEFFDRDWQYFSGFDGGGVSREDWCLSAISAFLRAKLASESSP